MISRRKKSCFLRNEEGGSTRYTALRESCIKKEKKKVQPSAELSGKVVHLSTRIRFCKQIANFSIYTYIRVYSKIFFSRDDDEKRNEKKKVFFFFEIETAIIISRLEVWNGKIISGKKARFWLLRNRGEVFFCANSID